MKTINIIILLSFMFHPTHSMACENHTVERSETHCEEMAEGHEQRRVQSNQIETNSEEVPCPICKLGFCFQSQVVTTFESILKTQSFEKTKTFTKPRLLIVFSPSLEIRKSIIRWQPHLKLPQHKNWQSFYSVFLI